MKILILHKSHILCILSNEHFGKCKVLPIERKLTCPNWECPNWECHKIEGWYIHIENGLVVPTLYYLEQNFNNISVSLHLFILFGIFVLVVNMCY